MSLALSSTDARRVKTLLSRPQPCLLCGSARTAVACLFDAAKPLLWGGKPGHHRYIAYRLCRSCLRIPEQARVLQVEGRLAARVVGRTN